jgi:glucans biosynthesis protein
VAGLPRAEAQVPTPQAAIQAALGEGQRFDPAALADVARQLARRPFVRRRTTCRIRSRT